MYWVRESVIRYAPPRATSIMPKVTMNDGSCQRTTMKPLTMPVSRPVANAAPIANGQGQPSCTMATPSTA